MLDQEFSEKNFLRLLSKNEIIKYSLGRNKKEYQEKIRQKLNFQFTTQSCLANFNSINCLLTGKSNSKKIFSCNDLITHLMLKKTAQNLRRLYRIQLHSRNDISSQVLTILENSFSYNIIKIDISSFYENIPFISLIKKLQKDRLLTEDGLSFLSDLQKNLFQRFGITGLPRGLSISPFLAEIYIRTFDEKIKTLPDIYYFSRYVDDILIITLNNRVETLKSIINELAILKLNINKKSETLISPQIIDCNRNKKIISLTYLGYKYEISNHHYFGKRIVKVLLSEKKIKKIKSRIMYCFLDYSKNSNIDLLLLRIKTLAGNYPIYNPSNENEYHEGRLKSGVYYSNPLVNQPGIFKEFNLFIRKLVTTRKQNHIGTVINNLTTKCPNIISMLNSDEYNFYLGFINKVYHEIDKTTLINIKKCWKNKG